MSSTDRKESCANGKQRQSLFAFVHLEATQEPRTRPQATAYPETHLPKSTDGHGSVWLAGLAEEHLQSSAREGALTSMLALTQLSNYLTLKGSFSAVSKPNFASKYARKYAMKYLRKFGKFCES